ncbi:MAG: glycosyltransferase [Pirellulales bacterium]
MRPNISVILSTYNSPDWLEKVLWGYAVQTDRDFEVIVADDGSNDAVRRRIDRMCEELDLNIRHIWQPDDGFRKSTILNKAIVASHGNYLIISDGDCVPRSDYVAMHRRFARPKRFLSGGYFMLPMGVSVDLTRDDVASGRAMSYRWLREQGVEWSVQCWKLQARVRWPPFWIAVRRPAPHGTGTTRPVGNRTSSR